MIKLGVTGIVTVEGTKCVVLIRRKGGQWDGYWSLPGGGVHKYETLRKALEREVREESGFRIKADRPHLLPVVELIGNDKHKVIVCLSGKIIGGKLQAGSDASQAGIFPLYRVPPMKITPITRKLLRLAKLI